MSGIAIFNTAVRQLQNSQKNLMAISEARKKLEQENELFTLKKKKAELDIDMAVKEGKMTDLQAEVLSAQNKAYLQQEQDKMKGNIASIKLAEQENKSISEKAMHWAKIGYKSDPEGVAGFLQAVRRNQARTQEIRPKMSYEKIGYETVDINDEEQEREDRASIRESRELDIKKKRKELEQEPEGGYSSQDFSIAKEMAYEDGDINASFETKIKRALPKAKALRTGKSAPSLNKYSVGDRRVIKGITYIKSESGKWLPES